MSLVSPDEHDGIVAGRRRGDRGQESVEGNDRRSFHGLLASEGSIHVESAEILGYGLQLL